MIGRFSLAAILLCLGACASSGPEAPQASQSEPQAAPEPPAAQADAVTPEATSTESDGSIEDLPAPNVEQTASVRANEEDQIVCRMETATGTRMRERVCRKQSDIDAAAEDSQDALRGMRKSGSQLERGTSN